MKYTAQIVGKTTEKYEAFAKERIVTESAVPRDYHRAFTLVVALDLDVLRFILIDYRAFSQYFYAIT